MGDPKKARKKFSKPTHPWNKERIEEEKRLSREYGLKRKDEIWKMSSLLKRYFGQAKQFIAATTDQSAIESQALLRKLTTLGVLPPESHIEDVLGIQLKDIMDRRLQTLLVKKNMAHTMNQARQFIVHEHISIGDKKITSPSYLVTLDQEASVSFSPDSALGADDHPERAAGKKDKKEAEKKAESDNKEDKPAKEPAKAEEKAEDKSKSESKPAEKKAESKEAPAKAEEKPKEESKPEAKEESK